MALNWLLSSVVLVSFTLSAVFALQCHKCGTYNDGVGSITPCIDETQMRMKNCKESDKYCIKYISEGSIVKDCVAKCTEREDWGTITFCCKEDGCNTASTTSTSFISIIAIVMVSAIVKLIMH